MMRHVYKAMRVMDIGVAFYFGYYFTPRIVGIPIFLLYGYRLLKSYLPGGNTVLHRFVDCSQYHHADDRHRHEGAPPSGRRRRTSMTVRER